jgi:hypothetical protein
MNDHHDILREIIDLFVHPERKKRIIYLWEKPKRRAQLLDELLHCAGDFRDDRSIALDPPLENPQLVAQRMRKLGAGKSCFGFGHYEVDGLEVDLDVALAQVVGQQREVLLYCRKSQVAFVEEHDGHQLLLYIPPRVR